MQSTCGRLSTRYIYDAGHSLAIIIDDDDDNRHHHHHHDRSIKPQFCGHNSLRIKGYNIVFLLLLLLLLLQRLLLACIKLLLGVVYLKGKKECIPSLTAIYIAHTCIPPQRMKVCLDTPQVDSNQITFYGT